MKRGHTPFGYRIENGAAVVNEEEAGQIRKLCAGYLDGLGMSAAARAAGLTVPHASVKLLMLNPHYGGDDFYPAILDRKMQDEIEAERRKRSKRMGRDGKAATHKPARPPGTMFWMEEVAQSFDDPYRQAEYLYSLIRRGN